jgi:hypothetical protein
MPRQVSKILKVVTPLAGHRHLVKECCLTAPGNDVLPDAAAIERWNDAEPKMWQEFVRLMRKRYESFDYAAVVEVQKRGAFHVHFLVIGPTDKIDMEFMQSCAIQAGYGPRIQLQSAQRRRKAGVYGAVRYLTKYITKSLAGFDYRGRHPVRFSSTWTRLVKLVRQTVKQPLRLASKEVREAWYYGGLRERWERANAHEDMTVVGHG